LDFVGCLALKAFQLSDIQCRILRNKQFVAAHLHARSCRLLKIVAPIKLLCEHDLGIGVAWPKAYRLLQPFPSVVKPVRKQRNAAQLQDSRIVFGVLVVNRLPNLTHDRRAILTLLSDELGWGWDVIVGSALEAPALISSFDDVAVVGQTIEQRGRHLGITEDARPFTEGEVCGDND
jgi:hypothetical protein